MQDQKVLSHYLKELASIVKPVDAGSLFEQTTKLLKTAPDLQRLNLTLLKQILSLINALTLEEQKLLSLRASNVCWKLIAREFKYSVKTLRYKWQKALSKISHQLN